MFFGLLNIYIVDFLYFFIELKNHYLNLKNKFSSENEYLAVVNQNGLWIKEEINNFQILFMQLNLMKMQLKILQLHKQI